MFSLIKENGPQFPNTTCLRANAFSEYCVAHLEKKQHADTGTHDEQQQLNKTHHVESRSGLRDLVQSLGEQQRN